MLVLYNGEKKDFDVTQVLSFEQILEGIGYRQKKFLGQEYGDFKIIMVDYDWGTCRQRNIARCLRCGMEKEIPNLRDFERGKGVSRFCRCGYEVKTQSKKQAKPKEDYSNHVGETYSGINLVDYQKDKGFRAECIVCGKQRWISGKAGLAGTWECNHKKVRDYSDPKYMGMHIGNLTVIGREGKFFTFRCDCGEEITRKPTEVFRLEAVKTCGRSECQYHKALLKKGNETRLAGISFENEWAEAMEQQGFAVEMTPESGDFGVDFFATINEEKVAFQCKKLKPSSVVSAVQEVYAGGRYYDCCKFVVVSPSGFSYPAELMASKLGVQLEKDLSNFELKSLEENKIATQKIQTFSKSGLIWEIDGVAKPAHVWCKEYEISKPAVTSRIKQGMTLKEALTMPKYSRNNFIEIDGIINTKKTWCDMYGISAQLYDYRVKYSGLTPKEALQKSKGRL